MNWLKEQKSKENQNSQVGQNISEQNKNAISNLVEEQKKEIDKIKTELFIMLKKDHYFDISDFKDLESFYNDNQTKQKIKWNGSMPSLYYLIDNSVKNNLLQLPALFDIADFITKNFINKKGKSIEKKIIQNVINDIKNKKISIKNDNVIFLFFMKSFNSVTI